MKVRVNSQTLALLNECGTGPIKHKAERRPDGDWNIVLEEDTNAGLKASQLPGESDDDTISRICRAYLGREAN
jgi:hypothetical protein